MTYTQKGECRNTGRTHFKKGYVPQNKNIELRECSYCNTIFSITKNRIQKYCSQRCSGLASKGRKPWNYIDGRSKLLAPARYGDDWDKIRYLVYLRDKFTCQDCEIKGIRLDVHHIIPFLVSRDNSLKNLISLCRSCHMKQEKNLIIELKGGNN